MHGLPDVKPIVRIRRRCIHGHRARGLKDPLADHYKVVFLICRFRVVTLQPVERIDLRLKPGNLVDLVEDVLPQLGTADLSGDHFKNRSSVRTGLPLHTEPDRIPRTDVADLVYDAPPEIERHTSAQAEH